MSISENNLRFNLLRRLSADSGTEIIYRASSDFPQLPDYVLFAPSRGWRMFPTPGRLWIDGIGIEDATSDLAQLAQWADELSGFNWSVATGHESGVFALEATEPYGLRSLRELSQLDWPETLYSSSSNYLIAFFRYPNRRRAIGAGKIEIAPGIIVRTDGESVVIPPPHDPERWPVSDEAVLESPEWLSECVFASIEPDPAIQETRRFTLIRGGLYGRTTQK